MYVMDQFELFIIKRRQEEGVVAWEQFTTYPFHYTDSTPGMDITLLIYKTTLTASKKTEELT